MVNFNGKLLEEETVFLNQGNRAFKYGDALFETMRVVNGKVFFLEDHYFRLMASMRILRMEIPMDFTMEFIEEQIKKTLSKADYGSGAARVRMTVFRKNGGLYVPSTNEVSWVIEASQLNSPFYAINEETYRVELFKDYFVNADMLSNLKSTNKAINVVAGVFAKENGYQNCLLLNHKKQVVEAINGNLFLVFKNEVVTPPLPDGCLNGVLRKKLIEILHRSEEFEILERSVSPFELQKADEVFITNVVMGIVPVTDYRKKNYGSDVAKKILGRLNAMARLA
ncbi:MAG: aminotransferase class IV [Muricauda sp.]|uniref:branched-chain-amino-acid transaminase n=1 Tax=Flagellimonas lutaonensis TaxID=516051 RepID=A0A0D5YW69_9FLAO|nr:MULTISPECIES: aminotransferase class IV [Allomuricauda]AKA36134.1 aminotransferase class IV [Allomuricauda lutaonensis]MBC30883.1 aminotransferase class IV [Allomuricauda sp.]|tara:strand:+ start:130 stop:975 length:846 start_codon:yes stop_codon:yes gene_type:complete